MPSCASQSTVCDAGVDAEGGMAKVMPEERQASAQRYVE